VNELNSIIHPVLWKKINELALQKEKDGVKIFVKEAAILLQKGRPNDIDYVILLDADQSNRIERVKTRDNTTSDLVVDRMNKQQKFSEVKHLADFIVFNNESKSELEKKANELYKILISKN
jgi:dephospho-CoA kinase